MAKAKTIATEVKTENVGSGPLRCLNSLPTNERFFFFFFFLNFGKFTSIDSSGLRICRILLAHVQSKVFLKIGVTSFCVKSVVSGFL